MTKKEWVKRVIGRYRLHKASLVHKEQARIGLESELKFFSALQHPDNTIAIRISSTRIWADPNGKA